MKKGDLVINKRTGKTGTIVREPWTKLFRDSSDWDAMRDGGGDYATAATAIRVCWHENGYEKTYKYGDLAVFADVAKGSNYDTTNENR